MRKYALIVIPLLSLLTTGDCFTKQPYIHGPPCLRKALLSKAENDDFQNKSTENEKTAKVVSKKGKKKRYKISDNRDSLPFVVKLTTPDPYTHVERKKEQARKNTIEDRKKKGIMKKKVPKYANLKFGGIAASIFVQEEDDFRRELSPTIGEFKLEKSTTSGDIIQIGDMMYQVQKARCQYKYAGGQKFEMVRKILEVKLISRVAEEAILHKSFEKTPLINDEPPALE